VKNGQITLDHPGRLPDGTKVSVEVLDHADPKSQGEQPRPGMKAVAGTGALQLLNRRQILQMPVEQRRQLLMAESERLVSSYDSDSDRSAWQGGDIIE
jgi:hypothetical protein